MNVWNKVLYSLIAILCVVFTIFAANKYSLGKKWQLKLDVQRGDIAALQDEIAELKIAIDGNAMEKAETWADLGVRVQLDRVRCLLRGDAFVNCQPIEAKEFEIDKDPITQEPIFGSEISFTVPASYSLAAFADAGDASASFRKGARAYVFDSGAPYVDAAANSLDDGSKTLVAESAPEGAATGPRFLGEFQFVGAADSQAVLKSTVLLTADELAAIQESQKSGRSWIVCVDRLPMNAPANLAQLIQDFEQLEGFSDTFASLNAAPEQAFQSAENKDKTYLEYFQTEIPSPLVAQARAFAAQANAARAVDYQGLLARQFAARDAANILKARQTLALNDLTRVLVDHLVSIGEEAFDEDLVAASQDLYTEEDFAAAVERKRVASYAEKQATLAAALEKMNGYCDLVKAKWDEAQARVAECQAAVDATLAENARLATEIAQAQIALAKNAEEKSRNGGEPTTAFALSGI